MNATEQCKGYALSRLYRQRDEYKRDSAWVKGVREYAIELLEETDGVPTEGQSINDWLLCGAADWVQYSYGGCAFIYDEDIAKRLCCPSELKRKRNGELNPNSRETWFDVQARALYQAAMMICRAWHL